DRARRDRPACDSGFLRRAARDGANAAAVRCTAAAGALDERGRIPSPCGGGEHPAARRGGTEAGRRNLGDVGARAAIAAASGRLTGWSGGLRSARLAPVLTG